MTSISFCIATTGERSSLDDTLRSLTTQFKPGDEVLIDCNLGEDIYGNTARNRMMAKASREYIMLIDDDDRYRPGALDEVRKRVAEAPDRIHLFRMQSPPDRGGDVYWRDPNLRAGNISTQCFVVPNHDLGQYSMEHQGDFDFIEATVRNHGTEPIFQDYIICDFGVQGLLPYWVDKEGNPWL